MNFGVFLRFLAMARVSYGGITTAIADCLTAAKAYADGLVTGLLDDRGNYDASGNVYPSTGGSGTAGAIKKGDVWYISVQGTLGGTVHLVGSSIRALVDAPGQTAANWASVGTNLGYVPEDAANKATTMSGNTTSNVLYLTAKAIYDWAVATFVSKTKTVTALTSSGGVITIDCSAATDLYQITLTENVTSWVFTNQPAADTMREFEVQITQHASSAKTVVSPATSGKTAGGAWTQSATLSAVEVLGIRIFNGGTVHLFPSGVFA